MTNKPIFIFAFVAAALSVALGAFAAHALENVLTIKQHKTFETAARYQMYHSLALAFVGILIQTKQNKIIKLAATFFMIGIVIFCGSLYLITLLQVKGINSLNIIGAITPIGGLCFITGWCCLIFGITKK